MPLRGRFTGVNSGQGLISVDPPVVAVLTEGMGVATHLGWFTLAMPHNVNLATGSATGSIHFTAANGDRLSGDFRGQASPTNRLVLFVLVSRVRTRDHSCFFQEMRP